MPTVKDTRHLVTLDAPEGDVKVVDYTDIEVVRVFHSVKSGEIAEYGYGEPTKNVMNVRDMAQEYANGYVAGLEE